MRIQKFGHSCLYVSDRDANLLIDPGTFSSGYDGVRGLTAILITHAHADHLDVAGLGRVLEANPGTAIYCDAASSEAIRSDPVTAQARVTVVEHGDSIDVGTPVSVFGGLHAVIHADLPRAINVGFVIGADGSRLCHPGDSLVAPDGGVDVLAVPVSAPWMAVKEGVDYLRTVAPTRAIPIHEKVLASTDLAYRLVSSLAPSGTQWCDLDDGSVLEL